MDRVHSKWRKPRTRIKGSLRLARKKAAEKSRLARCKKLQEKVDSSKPPSSPCPEPELPSTSAGPYTFGRKVHYFEGKNDGPVASEEYLVISKSAVQELLKTKPSCECDESEPLLEEGQRFGVARKLITVCSECKKPYAEVFTSPRIATTSSTRPPFEINRLFVEAFITAGTGFSAMQTFSSETGIQVMSEFSWRKHLNAIYEETTALKDSVLAQARDAVRAAYDAQSTDEIIDIAVSYDGSWHKRGHTSLYAIGAVVEITTGLVVDFEVLSKHCHVCLIQQTKFGESSTEFQEWFQNHKQANECQKNFSGSSGSMEVEAALIMWKRSVDGWKSRYTTILSDGDSKTYLELSKANMYGPGVEIVKEECINHVAKRMTAGLEKILQDNKVLGVTLGGSKEGSLKQTTITSLTKYYRYALINLLYI